METPVSMALKILCLFKAEMNTIGTSLNGEVFSFIFVQKFSGYGFFFYKIPFINQDNYAFIISMRQPKNFLNLAIKTSSRVNQQ